MLKLELLSVALLLAVSWANANSYQPGYANGYPTVYNLPNPYPAYPPNVAANPYAKPYSYWQQDPSTWFNPPPPPPPTSTVAPTTTAAPGTTASGTTAAAATTPAYGYGYGYGYGQPAYDIWSKLNLCPKVAPLACDGTDKWRTIDGSCNNLVITWWGQSFTLYKRLCKDNYEDGCESPRRTGRSGAELPNARKVSTRVHYPREKLKDLSHMFAIFGQYVMHDVTKTAHTLGADKQTKQCDCYSRSSDCINVKLSSSDRLYGGVGGHKCLTVIRARDSREDFNCDLGHREQTNEATSWVDLSPTYGSTVEQAKEVRAYHGGLLKTAFQPDSYNTLMPSQCTRDTFDMVRDNNVCFVAGDERANSHALLASVQTVFVRYHNYLAGELYKVNPQWNDEELFQEARRLNIAIFQEISYGEWLPHLIGPELVKLFGLANEETGYFLGYNDKVFGNVAVEFAAAAGRIGHTLIAPWITLVDEYDYVVKNVTLRDSLFNTAMVAKGNQLTQLVRGCLKDLAWKNAPHLNEELTDWLVVDHGNKNPAFFHSLSTINVQRGRDVGLCFYNQYRRLAGLKSLKSFEDTNWISERKAKNLADVYDKVEDIELYSGGLSETPVSQGVVGPTFGYILARGFRDWKYGDRWWFENPGTVNAHPYSLGELKTIRKMTWASVLCNSLKIRRVTRAAFLKEDYDNPMVSCNEIYQLDFSAFKANWGSNYPAQLYPNPASYPANIYSNPPTVYPTPAPAVQPAATYNPPAVYPTPAPAGQPAPTYNPPSSYQAYPAPTTTTAAPTTTTAAPTTTTAAPTTTTPNLADG